MDEDLPFEFTRGELTLVGATVLFFFSTFLPWHDYGCKLVRVAVESCRSASAWQGLGGLAGIAAGLSALVLFVLLIVASAGLLEGFDFPLGSVRYALAGATLAFGVLKLVFAIVDHPGYGAWVGLVLLLALGAATFLRWREDRAGWRPPWM